MCRPSDFSKDTLVANGRARIKPDYSGLIALHLGIVNSNELSWMEQH